MMELRLNDPSLLAWSGYSVNSVVFMNHFPHFVQGKVNAETESNHS